MRHLRFWFFIIIIASFLCSSCSTVTVNYEANLATQDRGSGKYTVVRSIPNKMLVPCILTGIFYGGLCWANLVMPTSGQKAQLASEARAGLTSRLGSGNFEIISENIYRSGWKAVASSENLAFNKSTTNAVGKPVTISPEEFEKTIPEKVSPRQLASTGKTDEIPENWPQEYYYETDEYRYWTICGDRKKKPGGCHIVIPA